MQLASGSGGLPDPRMSSRSDDICLIGSSRRGSHLQTSAQPWTSESKSVLRLGSGGMRWRGLMTKFQLAMLSNSPLNKIVFT